MKCAWTGSEIEGKAYVLRTTGGEELVSAEAVLERLHLVDSLDAVQGRQAARIADLAARVAALELQVMPGDKEPPDVDDEDQADEMPPEPAPKAQATKATGGTARRKGGGRG